LKNRSTVIALVVVLTLALTAGISLAAAEGGEGGCPAGNGPGSRQAVAPAGAYEARFALGNRAEASQVRAQRCTEECAGECEDECLQAQERLRQRAEECLQGEVCQANCQRSRQGEEKGNPSPSRGEGGAWQDETLAPAEAAGEGGGACAGECARERERACDREQDRDRARLRDGSCGGCE